MRKALTRLAVTATAFVVPMCIGGGTAQAATSLGLPDVGDTVTVSAIDVQDIVMKAIGGGCTTTYEAKVLSTPIGPLYSISGYNVTIGGNAAVAYTVAQAGNALWYIDCLV